MKPLPLRPLPMPHEPLQDYIERLAHANGYHARELWSVLNRDGRPHDLILSDALNGYALPIFSGPAQRHINIPVELFGLHAADFTHLGQRWCPCCIERAAWFRPAWRLKVASVCATHGVHLLQNCPACNARICFSGILHGTCECGVRFVDVVAPAARKHTRLAHALDASLQGATFIDLETVAVAMTTPQLVRMICYVGRLVEGPDLLRPGKIQELGQLHVASRIFDGAATILADWPGTLWHCLEQYTDAIPADASIRRVFGPLYKVIYSHLRDPVYQFLRDAFESFLLDHWRGELCGRHRLFSKETIDAHPIRGLTRIARANGIGDKTLRRMVHHEWLPANRFNRSPKRQLITIDERELSALIPDPDNYLDLRSTARVLGIKRTRLRELVGVGAIMADAMPEWRRRNQWYFQRSHVYDFIDQLRQAAMPTLPSQAALRLNYVLQYWRITTTELGSLLDAMRRKEIPFFLATSAQLRDVVFDEDHLRIWLDKQRRTSIDWVSVTKAAELLGLKEQVVYELVAKNLLAASLMEKKGHIIRRISLPSLDRFRQEYVSLAALAKLNNCQPHALLKQMDARPVTGPKIDGGRQYFYRRGNLPSGVLSGEDMHVPDGDS